MNPKKRSKFENSFFFKTSGRTGKNPEFKRRINLIFENVEISTSSGVFCFIGDVHGSNTTGNLKKSKNFQRVLAFR